MVTSLIQVSGSVFIPNSSNELNAFAFIADADGDIVWWYMSHLESVTRARMSYTGKNMWLATAGKDGFSQLERVSLDGLDSQVYEVTATHDITPVTGEVMAYPSGPYFGCTVLMEITPDGTTKPIYDTTPIWGTSCHNNAIRYSEAEGLYTLSDLVHGDILFVDRKSGNLAYALKDFSYNYGASQHGHHLLNDSIIIFNNGSRLAQELSLNTSTMQSSEIWRYSSAYSSEMLGDVQRLPNGNTLVTYSLAGRTHEVDANGNLVMEVRFSQTIGYMLWRETLYGPPPDVTL